MSYNVRYTGPSILKDNEIIIINTIFEILIYSDPQFNTKIYKNQDKIIVHITPSNPEFKKDIIDNLLWINKVMKLKLIFSKSLGIAKIISFELGI